MPYGDQGISNAMSASGIVELGCEWNLRVDLLPECIHNYRNNSGGILHGNRGLFVGDGSASAELFHDYLTGVNRKPAKQRLRSFTQRNYMTYSWKGTRDKYPRVSIIQQPNSSPPLSSALSPQPISMVCHHVVFHSRLLALINQTQLQPLIQEA